MGTIPRTNVGGVVYHVLNRANERARIFVKPSDYQAFLELLLEAKERFASVEIFSFCVMPNHWHFALRPQSDGEISDFMHWIGTTHGKRWRAHHRTEGHGHLYQGRYKSFPIQGDDHFLTVSRYVERNPLRAKLVHRAEDWRWSSAWLRMHGTRAQRKLLSTWPVPRPHDYLQWVNTPLTATELDEVRRCVQRGRPYGDEAWSRSTATELGLEATLKPLGRPRKT